MEPNNMNTQNTSNGAQFGAAEGAGPAAQTGPAASTTAPMEQTETTMSQMELGVRVEPGVRVESRGQAEPKADGEKKKSLFPEFIFTEVGQIPTEIAVKNLPVFRIAAVCTHFFRSPIGKFG